MTSWDGLEILILFDFKNVDESINNGVSVRFSQ